MLKIPAQDLGANWFWLGVCRSLVGRNGSYLYYFCHLMNSGKAYSIDFGLSLILGSLLCDKQSININPIKCCHCMHI